MIDRGFSLKTQNWSSLVFKLDEKLECYTIILDLFDNLASRAGEQSQNWKAEILTNQPSTRKIVIMTKTQIFLGLETASLAMFNVRILGFSGARSNINSYNH